MSGKKAVFGLILIVVGFFLLLQTLNVILFIDVWHYFLPMLLIGFGIWLIIRRKKQDDQFQQEYFQAAPPPPPPPPGGPSASDSGAPHFSQPHSGQQTHFGRQEPHVSTAPSDSSGPGRVRFSKGFGDMFVDLAGQSLQNVAISMGAGDLEIKVHGGVLSKGLNRILISGFIGDVRILLPRDMALFAHCSNFVGDLDILGQRTSGFSNNLDAQTADYAEAESRLYIAANNFLGDIRLYIV